MGKSYLSESDVSKIHKFLNLLEESVLDTSCTTSDAEFAIYGIRDILDPVPNEGTGVVSPVDEGKACHSKESICLQPIVESGCAPKCGCDCANDYAVDFEDIPVYGRYGSEIDLMRLFASLDEEIEDVMDGLLDLACDLPKNFDKMLGRMLSFVYANRHSLIDDRMILSEIFEDILNENGVMLIYHDSLNRGLEAWHDEDLDTDDLSDESD